MWQRTMDSHPQLIRWSVLGIAALIAIVSARPYAGSWNDGATLATVETLVDQHTFVIDRSIFVDPALRQPGSPPPYDVDDEILNAHGTLDKVFVDGHYYAAKPFAPVLLWGSGYWLMQRFSGLMAARSATTFVYGMTLLISGLAYVVAVACIYEISRRLLGSPAKGACLAAAFGLGTVALAYSRSANSHLPQLAATAALFLALDVLAKRLQAGRRHRLLAAIAGSLLGLAYVFDQGVGPALLLCIVPLVAWRTWTAPQGKFALVIFLGAALPWIVVQHWLNYEIGHTLAAINSKPEHFAWPGSPWNRATMSGGYSHASFWRLAKYSVKMLVGSKGFLLHNPLMLAAVVGACVLLLRYFRRLPEYPEVACAAALGVAVWLVYAWGSNNYSGGCVSIRWFLPTLAPGFYVVAVYLRERPRAWGDVQVLIAGSVVLGLVGWWCGPWHQRMLPGYWFILAALLVSWSIYNFRHWLPQPRGERAVPTALPLAK